MPVSGSCLFSDAREYQAHLQLAAGLLVTSRALFRARLTAVELRNVGLVGAEESVARVAYLCLPPDRAIVSFSTYKGETLLYDGARSSFGSIVFHSTGQRFHQRTTEASHWGYIALSPATLSAFSIALTGSDVIPPARGCIWRPPAADWVRLLRLHAQACRLAQTALTRIEHPQVARALEQELISALIACLDAGEPENDPGALRYAMVVVAFEELLAANPAGMNVAQICTSIGVTEASLRTCCSRSLGMSPGRYLQLKRHLATGAHPQRREPSGGEVR